MTTSPDLEALVAGSAAGDRQAFAALFDALSPRVYGIVLRVVRDPSMSEEVAQEVFVEIWKRADRFDPERASVMGWASMLARRRAVDRVRREQSLRDRHDRAAVEIGVDEPATADPATAVTDRDEVDRVRRALAELPEEQEEVVRLAFLDGRTHQEIAEDLELPLGTVKGRIRLGLARLSRGLERTRSEEPR